MRIDIRDFDPANDRDTEALLALAWVLRHERHAGTDDVGTPEMGTDTINTADLQAAADLVSKFVEPPLTEQDKVVNKAFREIAEEKSKTEKPRKRADENDEESTDTQARVTEVYQRAAEIDAETKAAEERRETTRTEKRTEQDVPGLKPPIKITRGGHRPKRATPDEEPDECGDCIMAECNAYGWYCSKVNRELAAKGRKCKHYEADNAESLGVKNQIKPEDTEVKFDGHVMPGMPAARFERDDRELEDLISDTAQANAIKPLPTPVDEPDEDDDPLGLGLPAEPIDFDELRKQIHNVAAALVNAGQGGAVTKLARTDPETGLVRMQDDGATPVKTLKQLAENQLVRFMKDLREV